jgi:hypothetical protein
MIGLAISLAVVGVFLLLAGVSMLRSASNNNMPLLFRSLYQQTSGMIGWPCVGLGAVAVIAGSVIFLMNIL